MFKVELTLVIIAFTILSFMALMAITSNKTQVKEIPYKLYELNNKIYICPEGYSFISNKLTCRKEFKARIKK
jgi:hypothetical protein